jgi:hypothetical protein
VESRILEGDYEQMPARAFQSIRREECAASEASENLFGAWWDELDLSLNRAVVRPVDVRTATTFIEKYEWLGTIGLVTYCFGIFFDGACGGVVVYRGDYAENLGHWDAYGYTGRMLLLSRGCCTHWSPPNTASCLIRRSMDLLPPEIEVVTATVDRRAGEIGTIYQACGFDYVGIMTDGGSVRVIDPHDGRQLSDRGAVLRYGTNSPRKLRGLGLSVEDAPRKERYFGFRGKPHRKAQLRTAIADKIKPYPKRAGGVEETTAADQPQRVGSTPTPRFHHATQAPGP